MGMNDTVKYNGKIFKTGDDVRCYIGNQHIDDAKIYVTSYEESAILQNGQFLRHHDIMLDIAIFICHNNRAYKGQSSPNKFGYDYSWYCVVEREYGGYNELTEDVHKLEKCDPTGDQLAAIVDLAFNAK